MRALVLLLLFAPGGVAAEVAETVRFRHYGVVAIDRPLALALHEDSPLREGGRVFHGYARWHVDWRWRTRAEGADCRLEAIAVSLRATVTLPRLDGGTPAVRQQFDRYLEALRGHEEGHLGIARRAAAEIERALQALPAGPGCSALERQANAHAQSILARHTAEERRYDRDTDHGRRQGVQLP